MTSPQDYGEVRCERLDRVWKMTVDRASRMNGFTPEMFDALEEALTLLDEDPELWAGVLCFAGAHTTAGLDLPRFAAAMREGKTSSGNTGRVDPYGMRRHCRKPVVMAVQEIKRGALVGLLQGERAGLDEIVAMKLKTANSEDFKEGVASFREKRAARFQGR